MQQQGNDWERYLAKWQGIFFQPELNNVGGWIELEYHDPLAVAERFISLIPLLSRRKLLAPLKNGHAAFQGGAS